MVFCILLRASDEVAYRVHLECNLRLLDVDAVGIVHVLYADIAIPHIVAVVLQTEVTFVLGAATVVEQLECKRPRLLRELRSLKHIGPLWCP